MSIRRRAMFALSVEPSRFSALLQDNFTTASIVLPLCQHASPLRRPFQPFRRRHREPGRQCCARHLVEPQRNGVDIFDSPHPPFSAVCGATACRFRRRCRWADCATHTPPAAWRICMPPSMAKPRSSIPDAWLTARRPARKACIAYGDLESQGLGMLLPAPRGTALCAVLCCAMLARRRCFLEICARALERATVLQSSAAAQS